MEKVISSKLTATDCLMLQFRAKNLYNDGIITQPTVSAAIRYIVQAWLREEIWPLDTSAKKSAS